jgi:hypothetical protein
MLSNPESTANNRFPKVVNNDAELCSKGIGFETRNIASVVVGKRVNGDHVPIYFDHVGLRPPGRVHLVPKPRLRLWFAHEGAGGMVEDVQGRFNFLGLDLWENECLSEVWDADGTLRRSYFIQFTEYFHGR